MNIFQVSKFRMNHFIFCHGLTHCNIKSIEYLNLTLKT
jgi:hypothetical protein